MDPLAARGVATVVVGTAGHIDHGKTSLLRALTGIDADRLPEERARGMTIDVGYAHLAFEDGVELDFVDVPGHDRLIGNMLVGAGEIDAAMLVVAADDGPRQHTLEHLALLDALGIEAGLAVVTKTDVVDAVRVAEVTDEVRTLLGSTSLAGAPILAASSVSGAGMDAVRLALRALRDVVAARRAVAQAADGPLRLSIDRAFAVKGRGTVVTGSLRGGALERGAVLRHEPGGEQVRVREIQVHGATRDGHAGGRTALNVAGVSLEALRRGDVLTVAPGVVGTERLLVELRGPNGRGGAGAAGPAAKARARLRFHVGTDQVDAAMRGVPARPAAALLTLERATATFPGDRGVLREPASGGVIAGVLVLDPGPPRGISRRRVTAERVDALAAAVASGDPAALRAARTDLHGVTFEAGAASFAADVRAALEDAAMEAVSTHHDAAPVSAGLPLPRARTVLLRRLRSLATVERRDTAQATAAIAGVMDALIAAGRLARNGEALRDPARGTERPAGLEAAMSRLEAALSVAAPPPLDEAAAAAGCPPEGVRTLAAEGRIIRLAPDLAWAAAAYQRLAALALELARAGPLTPAAYRDATRTSRRFALAILEDLDRRGVLTRTAEGHLPGPRAPRRHAEATT